jgi:hypothetical protein
MDNQVKLKLDTPGKPFSGYYLSPLIPLSIKWRGGKAGGEVIIF